MTTVQNLNMNLLKSELTDPEFCTALRGKKLKTWVCIGSYSIFSFGGLDRGLIRTSLPVRLLPPLVAAFSLLLVYSRAFSFQSVLLLPPIVFPFFCHLILPSSFSLLSFGELLSYLFLSCGLERKKESRQEQERNQQPFHSPQSPHCHPPPAFLGFSSLLFFLIFLHL